LNKKHNNGELERIIIETYDLLPLNDEYNLMNELPKEISVNVGKKSGVVKKRRKGTNKSVASKVESKQHAPMEKVDAKAVKMNENLKGIDNIAVTGNEKGDQNLEFLTKKSSLDIKRFNQEIEPSQISHRIENRFTVSTNSEHSIELDKWTSNTKKLRRSTRENIAKQKPDTNIQKSENPVINENDKKRRYRLKNSKKENLKSREVKPIVQNQKKENYFDGSSIGVIGEMKNMINLRGSSEDSYFSDSSSDGQILHTQTPVWERQFRKSVGYSLFSREKFDPFVLDV